MWWGEVGGGVIVDQSIIMMLEGGGWQVKVCADLSHYCDATMPQQSEG